jgi:hypothetical protein
MKLLDEKRRRRLLSTGRARLWRSMRILREFGIAELAMTAKASKANAAQYVAGLLRARYLSVRSPRRNGSREPATIYTLAREAGPLPPQLRDDGTVLDFNTAAATIGRLL